MAKKHDIYKCPECDCLFEIKGECACECSCELSCCDKPMEKLVEQIKTHTDRAIEGSKEQKK